MSSPKFERLIQAHDNLHTKEYKEYGGFRGVAGWRSGRGNVYSPISARIGSSFDTASVA